MLQLRPWTPLGSSVSQTPWFAPQVHFLDPPLLPPRILRDQVGLLACPYISRITGKDVMDGFWMKFSRELRWDHTCLLFVQSLNPHWNCFAEMCAIESAAPAVVLVDQRYCYILPCKNMKLKLLTVIACTGASLPPYTAWNVTALQEALHWRPTGVSLLIVAICRFFDVGPVSLFTERDNVGCVHWTERHRHKAQPCPTRQLNTHPQQLGNRYID